MNRIFYVLMAVVMLALSSTRLHAAAGEMINVDVQGGTYTESGPILTNGMDYYDYSIASATGESNKRITLVQSSGAISNARLTYTADASTAVNVIGSSSMSATPYALLFDGYMTAISVRTISFTGLDASKNYDLVVYSQGETGRTTTLKINGASVLNNDSSSASSLSSGVNYALITNGISSNSSGALSFTYQGQLSGLQIKEKASDPPTPEPASLVLLGIGGLLGASRLKKKSAKTSVPAV